MEYSESNWIGILVIISLAGRKYNYYYSLSSISLIQSYHVINVNINRLGHCLASRPWPCFCKMITPLPLFGSLSRSLFAKSKGSFNFLSSHSRQRFTSLTAPSSSSPSTASASATARLRAHLWANPNGSGKRIVGYWLAGCSAAVFGIIVFGGLTRLTESGLSMVDWKPVHFRAPQSDAEWEEYFSLYQQYPEYQM